MQDNALTANDYARQMYILRNQDLMDEAISVCKEAIRAYPNSNFFYKILGDLLLHTDKYEESGIAYIENLKRIGKIPEHFKNFAKYYNYLAKIAGRDFIDSYNMQLMQSINKNEFSPLISEKILKLLNLENLPLSKKIDNLFLLSQNDKNVNILRDKLIELEVEGDYASIRALVNYRVGVIDREHSKFIDILIISILEKYEQYNDAFRLAQELLKNNNTSIIIRTIFRICRKMGDYSFVDEFIKSRPELPEICDFNVQYELVYYYAEKGNNESLDSILKLMYRSARKSVPILRTLYNFYLQFNKLDEAKNVLYTINELQGNKDLYVRTNKSQNSNPRIIEQNETDEGVWKKIKELMSDQEHNRQLLAMRDLIKGFSHELGQPVTNIRYSTQLYQMKMERGTATYDELDKLLSLTLAQTERIGDLLSRFRPIVSSKGKNEEFGLLKRIESVFKNLSIRLEEADIKYSVEGDSRILLCGDAIQFDQIFYNLISNSIYAIAEKRKHGGRIDVSIHKNPRQQIVIVFSDNGAGIPLEYKKKIFEPFFTTKDPSSGNGGEGLGLFIIWNILKIFNGEIKLDDDYKDGARFRIIIRPQNKEVK